MTSETAEMLSAAYVEMRSELAALQMNNAPVIPITVRQLEALVRVSEAQARMALRDEVIPDDVNEALRLFRRSTLAAARSGFLGENAVMDRQTLFEITAAEREVRGRIPLGMSLAVATVQRDLQALGLSAGSIARALVSLESRGEIETRRRGRVVLRIK